MARYILLLLVVIITTQHYLFIYKVVKMIVWKREKDSCGDIQYRVTVKNNDNEVIIQEVIYKSDNMYHGYNAYYRSTLKEYKQLIRKLYNDYI